MRESARIGIATAALMVAVAAAAPDHARAAAFTFQNIIDPNDPTFNQALGINNAGSITGYFGSGAAGHPNKGYTTAAPFISFTNENFPGSLQTQVTGINNVGTTVGFWSDSNTGGGADSNFGFVESGATFTNVNNPNTATAPPVFNQLLGVNDNNIAVGFYTDSSGVTHGYTYSIAAKTFSVNIDDPSAVGNTTAAAINNAGQIVGFYTDAGGVSHGFIDIGGVFTTLDVSGATDTSLLGLNNLGEAVGFDIDAADAMHGIACNIVSLICQQVDDPFGIGATTFNGVNDGGQIVGFYVNGAGNTIGLLADPTSVPEPTSTAILASGLIGVGWLRRRRAG